MNNIKIVKTSKELPLEDVVEAFIDTFVTNEAFGELPIAGTAIGIFKAFRTYKKERLKEKLKGFVEGADDLKQGEISKFIAARDPKDDPLLSEHLLELIEQAESEQKAKMIGVTFRRLVRNKINRSQFADQVRFINSIYIIDIFTFMHGYHNPYIFDDGLGDILVNHRICKRSVILASRNKNLLSQEKEQYIKIAYEVTGTGNAFLKTLHDAYKDKIEKRNLLED